MEGTWNVTYSGTGEEARRGDTVRWRWSPRDRDELEGVIVRMDKFGRWCDVRYYTGPSPIFPEIDHATRRIATHKLHLVRRAGEQSNG
jgi:hypothetical protein